MQEKALMFLPEAPQGNATCRSIKAKAGSWTNIIIEMLKSENERQKQANTAQQKNRRKKQNHPCKYGNRQTKPHKK